MKRPAVFVDVDGTLVDSNFHQAIAWLRALRHHGENARLAAIHRSIGMGGSELLTSLIGRDDVIDAVVTSGDVDHAKPRPDIFDAALAKSNADRRRVVVLGDSVWDVEAANRAHLPCGVEIGGFSRLELEASGASAVFRDPPDFIERMAESPFADLWT